jgi:hypothetical protein
VVSLFGSRGPADYQDRDFSRLWLAFNLGHIKRKQKNEAKSFIFFFGAGEGNYAYLFHQKSQICRPSPKHRARAACLKTVRDCFLNGRRPFGLDSPHSIPNKKMKPKGTV